MTLQRTLLPGAHNQHAGWLVRQHLLAHHVAVQIGRGCFEQPCYRQQQPAPTDSPVCAHTILCAQSGLPSAFEDYPSLLA